MSHECMKIMRGGGKRAPSWCCRVSNVATKLRFLRTNGRRALRQLEDARPPGGRSTPNGFIFRSGKLFVISHS